ncbi:MAG: uracil phosphoribosyltransferase [Alphaproteobacteria bacterium]|nr:uracil phosphoribosyltransferase [Alphaproteobacteria bacterium]
MKKAKILITLLMGLMSYPLLAENVLAIAKEKEQRIVDLQKQFPNLYHVSHPLVQHKLSLMRKKDASTNEFRRLLNEIALLMSYEATRDLPIEYKEIETPLEKMNAPFIAGKKVMIVPILRAGLGMTDALLELIPSARVGHIGLYRDEVTKQPKEYFAKIPDPKGRLIIVVDPMLATGNSSSYAIDLLKKRGIAEKDMRLVSLVSAPEGVKNFCTKHPEVKLFTASIDRQLDKNAYIVPGLGDAGDRLYGTK